MSTLDLAIIGNGTTAALIEADGTVVWLCLPAFDGDPVFCALLRDGPERSRTRHLRDRARGRGAGPSRVPDEHAILVTRAHRSQRRRGRDHRPHAAVPGRRPHVLPGDARAAAATRGRESARSRAVRPAEHYGLNAARATSGTHHIRYQCGDIALATHDRCLDHGGARRARLLPRRHDHDRSRSRRNADRQPEQRRADVSRRDIGLLARLGPQSRAFPSSGRMP